MASPLRRAHSESSLGFLGAEGSPDGVLCRTSSLDKLNESVEGLREARFLADPRTDTSVVFYGIGAAKRILSTSEDSPMTKLDIKRAREELHDDSLEGLASRLGAMVLDQATEEVLDESSAPVAILAASSPASSHASLGGALFDLSPITGDGQGDDSDLDGNPQDYDTGALDACRRRLVFDDEVS